MDLPREPPLGSYDYDLLVLGGGSGGLAVAKEAAGLGKGVMLVDPVAASLRGTQRELGGSTLNDCKRKFLQQASLLGKALEDARRYCWKVEDNVSHGWAELVKAVQPQLTTRSLDLKRELKTCGVSYLSARGEIVAPHTVEVTDVNGWKRCLTAETLVVATGGRPRYLDIPGSREHCLTSEDLLSLPHHPGRTLVVGGTAEGVEYAGFLFGLGLAVTVMPQPDLLPGFDRRMAQKVENDLVVRGLEVLHHCSVAQIEKVGPCVKDPLSGETTDGPAKLQVNIMSKDGQTRQEEFDTVLLAIGREAATHDMGLEGVGVQCGQDGRILVNESDQTSVDHIYAVGSVQHGRPSSSGLSVHAGTLLARRLYRGENIQCDYTNVPTVVLTPLEYAVCGLSEEEAASAFGEGSVEVYHSYYWPLEWELPARNKNSCYLKVICHILDHEERVVGIHVMGPNAADVVQGFAAAMKCGLTKRQLDATVGVRPSSAQVLCSLTLTQRASEALAVRGNC